jgi:hypothetical protein
MPAENKDNEWAPDEEQEIARLMKEHKLSRIKAIQKMQRQRHTREQQEKIYGKKT